MVPSKKRTHRVRESDTLAPTEFAIVESVCATLGSPGIGTRMTPTNLVSLPTEHLHKILWESLELNLVRTCVGIENHPPPFFCMARARVLLAFCHVDVASQLTVNHELICRRLGERFPLSDSARKRLQKRVLKSGCLTIDMLKFAMEDTSEAYLQEYRVDAGTKTLPRLRIVG